MKSKKQKPNLIKWKTKKLQSKKEKPNLIKWKTKKVKSKKQKPKLIKWKTKKIKSKKQKTEKQKWPVAPLGFRSTYMLLWLTPRYLRRKLTQLVKTEEMQRLRGKSARTIFIHVKVAWMRVGGESVEFFYSSAFLAGNWILFFYFFLFFKIHKR